MILNQNDTARLQAFTEAQKHGIYIPGMFIVETGDQNFGWVGKKKLDILFSCNTRTGFSDRNSEPKLCAISIANNGIHFLHKVQRMNGQGKRSMKISFIQK